MDPRNQTRRLSADRPARRQARAAVQPQRVRLRHRSSSFVLDGEAVPLGVDGRSDFDDLTATELTASRTAPRPKNKHPPRLHHVLFMSQLHLLLNVRLDALAARQQRLRKRYDLPLAR